MLGSLSQGISLMTGFPTGTPTFIPPVPITENLSQVTSLTTLPAYAKQWWENFIETQFIEGEFGQLHSSQQNDFWLSQIREYSEEEDMSTIIPQRQRQV